MIRQVVTVGPVAAAVVDYFAVSATPVSGTPLTLANTTPLTPRKILLTYGSEGSARTLALTGKGPNSNIQETLVIPSGAAGSVQSVQDFTSLTTALPGGGGWTAAMTLGTSSVAASPWQRVTEHVTPVNISFQCVVSGVVNYLIEVTNDDIEPPLPTTNVGPSYGRLGPIPPIVTALPLPGTLDNQSANLRGLIAEPITAWRLVLLSGTGAVTATAIEAGIRQGG